MSNDSTINILNLYGELSEAFESYFEKSDLNIFERSEVSNIEDINYIIVSSPEQAKEVTKDFDTDKNEIRLLCIGEVKDVKGYLLSNGRLFVNNSFVTSELGEYILNKFFFQNYNIHLDESFSSSFKDISEFKVTNHLSVGLDIDQVSVEAFNKGFNIVSLRSFIDHSVYYLTYLKQSGLSGLPYEVEYSSNEDVFVINMYANVKNFVAEYMIDAFGSVNNQDPFSYLLNIIQKSCDFLDITYLENPGKIIFTAFWNKNDSGIKGLAFNNIQTTAQTLAQLEKQISKYVPEEQALEALEKKQEHLKDNSLPGGLLELLKEPAVGSALNKSESTLKDSVEEAIEVFDKKFPDQDIYELSEEQFEEVLNEMQDQELVSDLTEADKKILKERIQKNQLIEAFESEMERVQESVENDDSIKQLAKNTVSEEMAKNVSNHIDANVLNKILSKEPEEVPEIPVKVQDVAIVENDGTAVKDSNGEDLLASPKGFTEPLPVKDENGELVKDKDGNTVFAVAGPIPASLSKQPVPVLDENGEAILDESGSPLMDVPGVELPPQPVFDRDGNPILDENGDQVMAMPQQFASPQPALDSSGEPVLDSDGNPVLVSPEPIPTQFTQPEVLIGANGEPRVDDEGNPILGIPDALEQLSIVNGAKSVIEEDIILPELKDEVESKINIAGGFKGTEEEVNAISAMPKEGDPVIKIGGSPDDPNDEGTLVKGGKESADDFVKKISGLDEDKKSNFMQVISAGLAKKDDKGLFTFKGSTPEEQKKKINKMVVQSLKDSALDDMDLKVKGYIQKEAPLRIANALNEYATSLGLDVNDLSDSQVAEFKADHISTIMNDMLGNESSIEEFKFELESAKNIAPKTVFNEDKQVVAHIEVAKEIQTQIIQEKKEVKEFEDNFKNKLESKLSEVKSVSKDGDKLVVSDQQVQENDVQNVIKQTMKETFEEQFDISGKSEEEIAKQEKKIVDGLSKTLDMDPETVKEIVSGAAEKAKEKEKQIVAEKVFNESTDKSIVAEKSKSQDSSSGGDRTNSMAQAQLMTKLKKVEEENKKLKSNLSAMDVKLKSSEESAKKLDDVKDKAKATTQEITNEKQDIIKIPERAISEQEQNQLMENLKAGKELSAEDKAKLAKALEREQQLNQLSKSAEVEIKKAQIEISKRDSFFKSEMDKAQKAIKAKEMVLDKAKESMKTVVSKKEKEIQGLKGQVNSLNSKLDNDQSTQLKVQLGNLERENETLARSTDVYKNKLESMGKSLEKNKKADNSAQLAEEVRSLKKIKNQLENKSKQDIKAVKSYEDRYNKSKVLETKLRNELSQHQAELKSTQSQFRQFKETQARLNQKNNQEKEKIDTKFEKELEVTKSENAKLKARLNKLVEEMKNTDMSTRVDAESAQKAVDQKTKAALEKSQKEVQQAQDTAKQLHAKVLQLQEKLKNGSDNALADGASANNGNANEKRLEQSVKKMNSELTKAKAEVAEKKKETMKFKTEITGLKNKLQLAAKELDKLKKASASKGKKKAA